jgi:hypothetical protein
MADTTTTRRALLGAISTAPLAIVTPALAAPAGDAAILSAWEVRQRALALIVERGPYFECEDHSPQLTEVYDQADNRIIKTTATTAAGGLAQAWVTWSYIGVEHNDRDKRVGDMIRRADFAALEAERGLDFEHVCMLQIVRTLRTLAGEA